MKQPPRSIQQQLNEAIELLQGQEFAAAHAAFQALLKRQPRNFDVLHLGGIAAVQAGRAEEGVTLMRRALALVQIGQRDRLHLGAIAVAMPLLSAASGALAGLALAFGGPEIDAGARALAWAAVAASSTAFAWRSAVLVAVYRLAGFPAWAGPLFPAASVPVVRAFLEGAADLRSRVPVRWGGREYVLEPTDR